MKGRQMRRLAAVSLALVILFSVGCRKTSAPVSRDAKMLNFSLMDVNDRSIDMRENLGKVVILDFWDTWCGPCRREIPHFVELYDEYRGQGLEIVGVAFGRNGKDAVKKFTSDMGMNYTSALMNKEAVKLFGSPNSIPTTFIINQNGEIVEKVIGYRDKSYFENKIKSLLKLS